MEERDLFLRNYEEARRIWNRLKEIMADHYWWEHYEEDLAESHGGAEDVWC